MDIVTFVLSTKNRYASLRRIIHEIKYLNIQVIIIDDNSDVKNRNMNIKLSLNSNNIRYIYLKKNMGQPFASNIGISLCNTKYIWFFDDDDFIKKTDVQKVIYHLKNTNVQGLLLSMRPIYKNKFLERIYPNLKDHKFNSLVNASQKVNTSCSIFNLNLVKKIGGWDSRLLSGKDTDLFLRFTKKYKFSINSKIQVFVDYSSRLRTTDNLNFQMRGKVQFLKKHWKLLSVKRIFTIIFTLIIFYPLFYGIKQRIKKFFFNKI